MPIIVQEVVSIPVIVRSSPTTQVVVQNKQTSLIIQSPAAQGPEGPEGSTGPAGPQGAQGSTGPQGPAGASGVSFFRFQQNTPASVWNINHGLGYRPNIQCFASSGVQMDPEIVHVDVNNATASFFAAGNPVAIGGEAECS